MPCQSAHCEHTDREAESGRVLEFLKEINAQPFDHEHPSYYGNVATLDADTAELCSWCKGNEDYMSSMSLELQLWWRRHKAADAKREAEKIAYEAKQRIVNDALAKLTDEERKALGFKR
jgi:hypothetical protein